MNEGVPVLLGLHLHSSEHITVNIDISGKWKETAEKQEKVVC